jgi:hypothetical protein
MALILLDIWPSGHGLLVHPATSARGSVKPCKIYEFLHATFGEYLVARLVVQAVRDAAARARTLRLGPLEGASPAEGRGRGRAS